MEVWIVAMGEAPLYGIYSTDGGDNWSPVDPTAMNAGSGFVKGVTWGDGKSCWHYTKNTIRLFI